MIADRYYFGRLSDTEKQIYQQLYKGILSLQDKIHLSMRVDDKHMIQRICFAITNDNPHLYYFDQCFLKWEYTDKSSTFYPNYLWNKKQIVFYNKKIENTVNHIIHVLDLASVSEKEKEKRIHDYLIIRVRYDMDAYASTEDYKVRNAHNILGVFLDQKAVCEGISKAVKLLLNTVNIACIVVNGTSKITGHEHAWNIVKINGKSYHLDLTWDLNQSADGKISYHYYNVSDRKIKKDHDFTDVLPPCLKSASITSERYRHM